MANSRYACVNAKIMAMRAKMLSDEDYRQMIREPDLNGVFNYLKNETYYAPFLKNVETSHLHRQAVEIPLNRMQIFEIEKIMHFLYDKDKRVLNSFLVKADVEALRLLIRGLSRGANITEIAPMLVYSKKYSTLPMDNLIKAKSWDEFKKFLIGTDYYRILEIYKTLSIDEDLFPIEKSLERHYYDQLRRLINQLPQKENNKLILTLKKGIDLLNLIWFYRGKKFYHLSREELLAYALRGGLRIKTEDIQQLTEIKTMDDFKQVIARPQYNEYAFLFNHTKSLDLHMERRRERFQYYAFKSLYNSNDTGLSKPFAFIRMIDFEIADIVSIIESKRYRMSATDTEEFLIRSFN
ncbi:MAG: V-type ATPase subunit [Eubacteriaceae bacterium]|nr:V-type ATPase subunit [Eubacteriaceae bacterium]MDD4507714.1 V-type ATPase subunit [Eubacteriaceae bacterium]